MGIIYQDMKELRYLFFFNFFCTFILLFFMMLLKHPVSDVVGI